MSDNSKQHDDVASINIGNVNNGAAVAAFDMELRKVLSNIGDLSTSPTATRRITLTVEFKPHSDRCQVETLFSCVAKLAPIETHKAKIFVGKTTEGDFIAYDSDPRQMPLWDVPKPASTPIIEFKTGTENSNNR